jgi:hypothetical protein
LFSFSDIFKDHGTKQDEWGNMMKRLATWALCSSIAIGAPLVETGTSKRKGRRDFASSSLTVDLDYAVYKGIYDSAADLNVWKGYVQRFFCNSLYL